jgi:hypothetical protein
MPVMCSWPRRTRQKAAGPSGTGLSFAHCGPALAEYLLDDAFCLSEGIFDTGLVRVHEPSVRPEKRARH